MPVILPIRNPARPATEREIQEFLEFDFDEAV